MLNTLKLLSLAFFTLVLMACSSTPTEESAGQFIDSSALTAKVKAELVDQLGTDGLAVRVKTYKNEVQLSGFVDNAIIKRRAGTIADHVIGVEQVRNDLIVKPQR